MSIPIELKSNNHWVCWKLTPDKDGKSRKVPVCPVTMKSAASNKPETWTDYETAVHAAGQYLCSGIGYMFLKEDGLVGVDIDHCYDPSTEEFNETAKSILSQQPTYTEFSPSGTGLHLFYRGAKPGRSTKNSEAGVEMYDSGRYFTVTGNQVPGTPDLILEDQGALRYIYNTWVSPPKKKQNSSTDEAGTKLSDEEVVAKASEGDQGEIFRVLWAGNWKNKYDSQSEADLALCHKLSYWTGKDAEQIDRLFRQSKLMRAKWDERHSSDGSTYGEKTIQEAIRATRHIYHERSGSSKSKGVVFELDGRYLRNKDDSTEVLTNFIIAPIDLITADDETFMTADFINTQDQTFRYEFSPSDLSSLYRFKNLLNSKTIGLTFYGTEGTLNLLKDYIHSLAWNCRRGVKAMGIYNQQNRLVFVSQQTAFSAENGTVNDIVQPDRYIGIQSRIADCTEILPEELALIGPNLLNYNEPAKTATILCWAAGCFLKEHLRMSKIKFPHLFLIGEAGSGKSTTLETVLLPIFSQSVVNAAPQITAFTLMKTASSSNIIPMALDEFKPSKLSPTAKNALYNHFRDSYDGHRGSRGRADLTSIQYELLAPLIVAGEESADEAAIRERTMELLFSKKDLMESGRAEAFQVLRANEHLLNRFGRTLLNTALTVSPEQAAEWHTEGYRHFSSALPSRIINNLACCYAGLMLLEQVCGGFGRTFTDIFGMTPEDCISNMEFAVREYLLDGRTGNPSIVEQTLEIMLRMDISPMVDYVVSDDRRMLYLRLPELYDRYTKYRRDFAISGEVLPYSQFKAQLKHSELCLKSNVSKRFDSSSKYKVWVIDLQKLAERCDISHFMEVFDNDRYTQPL